MDVVTVLNAAADLLENPGAWTQGAFARHANGNPIGACEDRAVCFCAVGAVYKTAGYGMTAGQAISLLARTVRRDNIGEWNDAPGRTQAEVVAALRQAALSHRGDR